MAEQTIEYPVPMIGEIQEIPVFLGTSPNSLDDLFDAGFDTFFLIGYEAIESRNAQNQVTKSARSALYMIRKNLVGYTQLPVSDQMLKLNQQLNPDGILLLPQIPWEMREKMSQFFHRAFELHGTESVLLLVYDDNFRESDNPSDGWGCIVPEQENTSGSCFYEINEKVMALKSPSQDIVGSVHSHPMMDAFFSGTDHKDQVDWDGLHITYGWKKNTADEYHIEMFQNGKTYQYKAEDIFALPPIPVLDDGGDIDQWLENVTKKATPAITQGGGGTHSTGHGVKNYEATTLKRPDRRGRTITVPKDGPSPSTSILITTVPDDALASEQRFECILCGCTLIDHPIKKMRCYGCKSFIAYESETIEDFHNRYIAEHKMPSMDELNPHIATRPIHFFYRQPQGPPTWSVDLRSEAAKK